MFVRDANYWAKGKYGLGFFRDDEIDVENYVHFAKTEVDNGK
jgi:hypothetical protein